MTDFTMENEKSSNRKFMWIAAGILVLVLIIFLWPERDPFYADRDRISEATSSQIQKIENGLDTGLLIEDVHIVQYEESNLWFTGGLLSSRDISEIFACWLIDEDSDQVYSIDYVAEEFSDFPSAIDAGFEISYPNEECGILANYLE